MNLVLNLHALMDSSADVTRLRAKVHTYEGSTFKTPLVELYERNIEVVWGDRHAIQVRNTLEKAFRLWAEQEDLLRGRRS